MYHGPSVRVGYFFVVLSALFWAMSGNAAKFIFQNGVSAFQLVQLRTTIASAFLILILFMVKRSLLKVSYRDLMHLIILGIILAAMLFTYLFAVSRITVAAAVLLQYQAPALIALYSFFMKREKPSIVTVAAIGAAIAGCSLMVGAFGLNVLDMDNAGIISGLISAVALAVYSVRSEYGMQRYSAWTVLLYALIVAAIIWNIMLPPFSSFAGHYSGPVWGWIIFISVFGTVLPFGLYNEGVRRIHSTHASITATLEPVMAATIAYSVLGEVMSPLQLIGGGMVIASVFLLQLTKR